MKRYNKEICFLLLCLMVVGGFVSLFFRYMEQEKERQRVDGYALIPERADAILRVKDAQEGADVVRSNEMGRFLPEAYRKLMGRTDLDEWTFSFHQSGVICYVKASRRKALQLNGELASLLGDFPPQRVRDNGVWMNYYSDLDGTFIGTFRKGGYWIASHSPALLAKTLQKALHPGKMPAIYAPLENRKGKSAADVWIYAPLVDVDMLQPDSTHWSISQPWLQADIYRKEDGIIAFSALSPKAYDDSTALAITDSLRRRFVRLLHWERDSLGIQYTQDEKHLYLRFELKGEPHAR